MKYFFLFLILFVGITTSVHAEWIGGTDGHLVDYIQINGQGSVRIYVVEGPWQTTLCSGYPNPTNVVLDSTHPGFSAVYSAILSAKATEKKIRIFASQCTANVPSVETIQLL